mmetsp:Transcript_27531/g.79207  ORF Transcript_27531/g.79207 Transcript_27531/m.79207 type:complete len:206 (-) Transcript_27531:263-880(-)
MTAMIGGTTGVTERGTGTGADVTGSPTGAATTTETETQSKAGRRSRLAAETTEEAGTTVVTRTGVSFAVRSTTGSWRRTASGRTTDAEPQKTEEDARRETASTTNTRTDTMTVMMTARLRVAEAADLTARWMATAHKTTTSSLTVLWPTTLATSRPPWMGTSMKTGSKRSLRADGIRAASERGGLLPLSTCLAGWLAEEWRHVVS